MPTLYVSSFSCANDVCVFHRPDILEQASSCGTIFIFSYQPRHPTSNSHYLVHNLDTPVPTHHDARASVRKVHCGAGAARTLHVCHPAPARRTRLARHALHCSHRHAQLLHSTCNLVCFLCLTLFNIYSYMHICIVIAQELPLLWT